MFEGFQNEYGVKVIQSNFDSMESMQAKLAAGNRYDIIFPSAQWVQKLVAANQLRTIDPSTLKNAPLIFDHYPYFADPWYDQRSAHSIPFSMYKTGIAWRKDKLGETLTGSWSDLWNETSKGRTFVLDDRDEVLGMLSLLLGYELNTAATEELEAIIDKFRSLRPYLRGFSSDDYNNLLAGDAWMHQTWSGDMAALLWQAPDPSIYGFEAPKQGTPVNSDAYAIPVNAQHPGTALLFIDYMLRPENVEKNINYIGYPMPVHGTEATYAGDRRRLPGVHGHRRGPLPQPLLHQRQRGQDPGPRRGVHGNEGRSMTTTLTVRARERRAAARPARRERLWTWMLVPGTVVDVGVLRLRAAAAHRAELRNH